MSLKNNCPKYGEECKLKEDCTHCTSEMKKLDEKFSLFNDQKVTTADKECPKYGEECKFGDKCKHGSPKTKTSDDVKECPKFGSECKFGDKCKHAVQENSITEK